MKKRWKINLSNKVSLGVGYIIVFALVFIFANNTFFGQEYRQVKANQVKDEIKIFQNVEALKKANLSHGDIVATESYYSKEYEGGAKYRIKQASTNIESEGIHEIILNNGLVAELIIENEEISPQQVGAYGDGIHDDTDAIQICMQSGYKVVCKEEAVYSLSRGITVGNSNTSILEGNNSVFNIDKIYSYDYQKYNSKQIIRKGLFSGIFFYFDRNRNFEIIDWKNITINWNVLARQNQVETYYLMKIWSTKKVNFNNVSINIKGNNLGAVQPIAIMPGSYGEIYFNKCSINNNNHGYTSSCLWFYGKCNNFVVEDSNFYSESMDEIISVISSYEYNIVFRNSSFIKENYMCANSQYTARNRNPNIMITHIATVNENSNESQTHRLTFDNCNFIAKSVETALNDFLYTNSYAGNYTITTFSECNIEGEFQKALLAAEMNGHDKEQITMINDNTQFQDKLKVIFENCTMDLVTPTIVTTRGVNFEINNSKITTTNALIDVKYVDSLINCWKGQFCNDEIYIKNAKGILKDLSDEYLIGINVNSCKIYTYNENGKKNTVTNISKQNKNVSNFVIRHSLNAISYVLWKNNTVNS